MDDDNIDIVDNILNEFSPKQDALVLENRSQDSVDQNLQIEDELFLTLKLHIDSQNKLSQLNQSRIRSFERFRKYCQRVAQFDDETIGFDLEQFRNEYNRFDRNYRYWRKRVRTLRKETKSSLSNRYQNPYDTLYGVFSKIEIIRQSTSIINPLNNVSITNNRSTQDQCIQCDFSNENQEKFTRKHPRACHTKTKNTAFHYLSPDQLYPEISINVTEAKELKTLNSGNKVSANNYSDSNSDCDFSVDDNGMISTDTLSEGSEVSKAKTVRGSKKTTQTKKIAKNDKIEAKTKSPKSAKLKKRSAMVKREVSSDSDFPDNSKKEKGRRSKITKGSRVHRCETEGCQYSTTSMWNMNLHRKTHGDVWPYQCTKCDMSFKVNEELKIHQNIHDGIRFHCTYEGCTKIYSTKGRLQRHLQTFHTKVVPLLHCDWEGCQYSTYRRNCLRTHRKIHDDQRPYKCPYCEKAFNSPSTLWNHRTIHDSEIIWKCDFEGCNYSSNRRLNLKNHKLIHSKVRPFACAWPGCGYSFKTPIALRNHKHMHENLRRYKCTWEGCDFASNLSHGVRRHIEGVHEKKPRKESKKANLLDLRLENRAFE